MRGRALLLFALLLLPISLHAQATRVTGRVTDQAGIPLAGVRVAEKGSLNTTLTNRLGAYELRVPSGAVVTFSRSGFRDEERSSQAGSLDVSMIEGLSVAALEVVGTRRLNRTETSTPLPVDIIDIADVTLQSGQLDLNQLLQYVAPSFNANRQSGADGADHVDPATLRGLGPDQTLVLINGKRRHQSSLVNIFGTRGRGNTGTDLNAIPVSAIDHIEILRDGASAQYGSDAIAGVINIVLKSDVGALTADFASGTHNASPPSQYDVASSGTDGTELRGAGGYGIRVGENGFIHTSADFVSKQNTNRPASTKNSIYRKQFGDAALDNGGFFINSLFPLSNSSGIYAFGGANFRHTDAFAWTREADSDRNVPAIYPNGFDPHITSNIRDLSLSLGWKTKAGAWDVDVNTTAGGNRFHYIVDKTLNATLGAQSPTEFDAGGFSLFQNTAGVHATRLLNTVGQGLNLAFGGEWRHEKYSIFAGEQSSYKAYTATAPGGAQGFPGFQPKDEIDASRDNIGGYADLELDASKTVTLGAAARAEHYSDFGNTLTARLNARIALSDAVALRGSAGTGFRAPSLAQIHFSSTYTDVVGGTFVDKVIAPNGSAITKALGIPDLTEETARSASIGITAKSGNLSASVDGYLVNIDDRIVLTGSFEDSDPDIGSILQQLHVGAAQFFTNALDTKTKGLDVVVSHQFFMGDHNLRWSLAGNFNKMELGDIHTTAMLAGKEDTYFGSREKAFLLASAPSNKFTLAVDHSINRFDSHLRITNFGHVSLVDWGDTRDIYKAKATTDLSLGYRLAGGAHLTVGATNMFNLYPSEQNTDTESGGMWDPVQMGFSGAFYFARLSVRL